MHKGGLYLTLGDSITHTIPDSVSAKGEDLYAAKIWRAINSNYGNIRWLNMGYGGNTSTYLLAHLNTQGLRTNYDLVTIQVGMNDCANAQIPASTYKSNMSAIIDKLRTSRPACEIILCNISPTNDATRTPHVADYRTKIVELVTEKSTLFADFSNAFTDFATYCPTGVHPNIAGQILLYDILWTVVQTTTFVSRLIKN